MPVKKVSEKANKRQPARPRARREPAPPPVAPEVKPEAEAATTEPASGKGAAIARPDPTEEIQCVYCGVRFEAQLLDRHQVAMHKGMALQNEPTLPAGAESLAPGSVVRTSDMSTMKVPWTRKWIEQGYECTNHDHHYPERGGWRKLPVNDEVPTCSICGEPMRKMFQMMEWDAPDNSPVSASFQGVKYQIQQGATNVLPDVIVSILRESIESRKTYHLRKQPSDPMIGTKLNSVGFLPSLESEDDGSETPVVAEAPVAP